MYESSAELDELMAMHLGSVRVEHDENIEAMLEVSLLRVQRCHCLAF